MYEIHITVEQSVPQKFIQICSDMDVKPLIIDLMNGEPDHWMTSSCYVGSHQGAMDRMAEIEAVLLYNGFKIIRSKIEASPNEKLPALYFEVHLELPLENLEKLPPLTNSWYPSHNKNKDSIIMLTSRVYKEEDVESLRDDFKTIQHLCSKNKFIVEHAIYDTNPQLDSHWILK